MALTVTGNVAAGTTTITISGPNADALRLLAFLKKHYAELYRTNLIQNPSMTDLQFGEIAMKQWIKDSVQGYEKELYDIANPYVATNI